MKEVLPEQPAFQTLYPQELEWPPPPFKLRSTGELDSMLGQQEQRKTEMSIIGETGQAIGSVEYDPETGTIISIRSQRYINPEAVAEHPDEKVYVTDEQGNVMPERISRAEARQLEKRYLVATCLIFRGDKTLVQKRSPHKEIDPDKISSSAHGVAKELLLENGERITHGPTAALINTVLEINEELRHGADPFNVRIWPGNHEELIRWAEEKKLDDPETIWLVPEAYLPDDSYPLGWSTHDKRTRALSAGFIFSTQKPRISIDPGELEGYEWKKDSEIYGDNRATDDLRNTSITVLEQILKDSPLVRRYGQKLAENIIRRHMGLEIDKP